MTKAEKKAMHIVTDIDKLKLKRGECIRLAEDKDDMAYVHKGLVLRRKSTETKDSMKVVEKEIQELEKKNRKLLQ